ncbi:MAG: metal-dependent transcriptional regulator [Methanomicrobiales archaeon]|nr:metal-dependent transcriptional regulator [Methanomicrobiales archaeon]
MEHAACEDLLEAIFILTERSGSPPTAEDLAAQLGRDAASLEGPLREQERAGRVEVDPSGAVTLLPAGHAIASRVAGRHRILECFLAEKLGMEPKTASGEACHLEHEVSEETIRRLSEFLVEDGCLEPPTRHRGGRGDDRAAAGGPVPKSLGEYPEGTVLRVAAIGNFSRVRRLEDIGLLPGESLTLRRRLSNGSVVVEVKGSEVALSAEVAACILVEERG